MADDETENAIQPVVGHVFCPGASVSSATAAYCANNDPISRTVRAFFDARRGALNATYFGHSR